MTDKLLNTEYEKNPFNSSGASEAHLQADIQTEFQTLVSVFRGEENA
jgi:hypothetical protein